MEIKNLKKAADRIIAAVKNKEKIILYGDADLDGVSSVIILKESIKNLGGDVVSVYFPDRENEGYGLNESALGFLKDFSPAVLLVLDCGISNFKEVKQAKRMGFEVVIIDHHEVLGKMPEAEIIVDPKQKGDKYPFKTLAAAGIVFKLSQVLLKDKFSDSLRKNFLEMATLATIADMMPETEENKIMIDEGIPLLKETFRPGLKAFFETDEVQNADSLRIAAQRIISVLNIVEPKDHLNATYLILTGGSANEAGVLINELSEKRGKKQKEVREITEQIEGWLSRKEKETIVFEGSYSWPLALLGSVASRICNKYQKPTLLFKKKEKESRGAVRVPAGQNGVEMMKKCSKYLTSYGGHPQAAGFYVKNENLEKFKQCLMENL